MTNTFIISERKPFVHSNTICRFTGKIDIDYKLEIEPEKIKPRASFKGSLPGQPHIIEKSMKLHEQSSSDFKCREHQVYIDVSRSLIFIRFLTLKNFKI